MDKFKPSKVQKNIRQTRCNHLVGKCRRFGKNRSGSIAVLFALALVPILISVGVAMDYSRSLSVQSRLSKALDAAALAVGSSKETNPAALRKIAQNYFNANYPTKELGVPGKVKLIIDADGKITVSGKASLKTSVLAIVGMKKLDVGASVVISRGVMGKLEVVMVLDNTSSMTAGKMAALKSAANILVNILVAAQGAPGQTKFAIVPYGGGVNVGTQYRNAFWMDTGVNNPYHQAEFTITNSVFDALDQLAVRFGPTKGWNGCVMARPKPHDTLDTPPNTAAGSTLWVPYLAPDEADFLAITTPSGISNSYIFDQIAGPEVARQRHHGKYGIAAGPWTGVLPQAGQNLNCTGRPITALTTTIATVQQAINDMDYSSTNATVTSLGVAWGWRVLSPGEPFTQGADYDDDEVKKIMVIMTDGENCWCGRNPVMASAYNISWPNAYGYVAQRRLGPQTTGNWPRYYLDQRTAEACTNAKNMAITVYTVTFDLTDSATKVLWRNCASDPGKYFDAQVNSSLIASFQAIANDIETTFMRISK